MGFLDDLSTGAVLMLLMILGIAFGTVRPFTSTDRKVTIAAVIVFLYRLAVVPAIMFGLVWGGMKLSKTN